MPDTGGAKPRSLADDLRARSTSEIEALLRGRPDLLSANLTDIRSLANVASDPLSVSRALDDLSSRQLQLVEVLAALDDPFSADQAAESAALGDVSADIAHLRTRALLWGTAEELHVTRYLREAFGQYPCGLAPRLTDRKPQLNAWLADPSLVVAASADLPETAKALLQDLVWQGPETPYPNAQRHVDPTAPKDDVELLLSRNLLVAIDESTVLVPREVALPLRRGRWLPQSADAPSGQLEEAGFETVHISNVETTSAARGYSAMRSLAVLVDQIDQQPLRTSRARTLLRQDLNLVASAIRRTPEATVPLVQLGLAAGLIAHDPDEPELLAATTGWAAWRQLDVGAQWALVAHAWIARAGVAARMLSSGVTDEAKVLTSEVQTAEILIWAVLDGLAALSAGEALSPSEFETWLPALRPRAATATLSCLEWMSAAEGLGLLVHGAVAAAGRHLLRDDLEAAQAAFESSLAPAIDKIYVQPDNTVVVPGRPTRTVLDLLQKYGSIETEDSALVVRITAETINSGLYAGGSAEELESFLRTHSATQIGQALSYLIADQQRRFGSLRTLSAHTLLVSDESDAAKILSDSRLAYLRLKRVSSTVLATDVERDLVTQGLRQAGFAPVDEGGVVRATTGRSHGRALTSSWDDASAHSGRVERLAKALTTVESSRSGAQAANSRALTGAIPERISTALETQQEIRVVYTDADAELHRIQARVVHTADGFTTFYCHDDGRVQTVATARIASVD